MSSDILTPCYGSNSNIIEFKPKSPEPSDLSQIRVPGNLTVEEIIQIRSGVLPYHIILKGRMLYIFLDSATNMPATANSTTLKTDGYTLHKLLADFSPVQREAITTKLREASVNSPHFEAFFLG